jgi:ribosomal protein L16 Arg81 hydroxylase
MRRSQKNEDLLSPRFWTRFAKQHWEKRPIVLRRPFDTPLTTTAQLFRGLISARQELAGKERRHLRLFAGDEIYFSRVKRNLPRRADASFDGYCKRMKQSHKNARFGLVVVDYPSFDAQIRNRVEKFLRPLKELVASGINSKTLLFLGDYERTPIGIHKDPHGTFVFVIEGRKRFRSWPSDFFPDAKKITGCLRYRQFLDGATTLEGTAGDLIYWPSSYWHIGEPVGGFSITLNVGMFSYQLPENTAG